MISSAAHPGDGAWQFLGMTGRVDMATTLDARFEINNNTGIAQEVYLSCPTMNFGMTRPELAAKPISTAGGIITGTLTNGMVTYNGTSSYITLPKEGNIFEINTTIDIHRINHSGDSRFPRGTIIILLFNNTGITVLNGAYIKLKGAYTSLVNSSLTLVSEGNGTWREVNRNL